MYLFILALGLTLLAPISQADINLEDKNPFQKTPLDEAVSTDDYSHPFLITRTTWKYSLPPKTVENKIRNKLKIGRMDLKTQFSNQGMGSEAFLLEKYKLPAGALAENQVEGIKSCSAEKCLMKLRTKTEVILLEKSKNKIETFRQLMFQRIKNYLAIRELTGYEDRKSNIGYVPQMLDLIVTLKLSPVTLSYLKGKLWTLPQSNGHPLDSWIKQEMVIIAPDQMQPILRISESLEFHENERVLFLELPFYTAHYFDSSLSLYEVVANKKNPNESLAIITDVMEIDELKKSSLIRTLFKGKMVRAVTEYQTNFLGSLGK